MRIKLDENLPEASADILQKLGHDAETVHHEGLSGRDDDSVWAAAQGEARFFITQDLDFSNINQFVPGTHRGLLLLRLRSPGRIALTKRLEAIFRTESVEEWQSCFVVATDRKIRVRRPGA
jgi:predicted nuclease of predicted toxin-antitoxin system